MHDGIVHRIAGHVGACQLFAGSTHLQCLVVVACHGAVKLILQAAIGGGSDVGHTGVGKEVEAGTLGGVDHGRAVDALEAVDHQDLALGLGCDVCREHLGGEALATTVDGRDLEAVHASRL